MFAATASGRHSLSERTRRYPSDPDWRAAGGTGSAPVMRGSIGYMARWSAAYEDRLRVTRTRVQNGKAEANTSATRLEEEETLFEHRLFWDAASNLVEVRDLAPITGRERRARRSRCAPLVSRSATVDCTPTGAAFRSRQTMCRMDQPSGFR